MSGTLLNLHERIAQRQITLGVVGLGYVGLPVACVFAEAGFRVVGVDLKAERVATINAGHSPIEGYEPGLADMLARVVARESLTATTDFGALARADVILVSVETPVDAHHRPAYDALKAACRSIGTVLAPGALVVIESTIAPGTMERVVRPLIESAAGRTLNEGFFLGHCPERVMPGKLLNNLRNLSRVCGGSTPETSAAMIALYRTIVQADLDAADCVTAELVKTAENAYRDVNIAFANEVALVCEATGGDFLRVRELVNKSPGRNLLFAGGGVGGHCIPKDPWLFAYGLDGYAQLRLIPAARAVNNHMPRHVADMTARALEAMGRDLTVSKVAVLGYAYMEESDITLGSPSIELIAALEERGATCVVHDPWIAPYQGDLLPMVTGCDAVIIMVAHQAYRTIDWVLLRNVLQTPLLVDARRVVEAQVAHNAGLLYYAVGMGRTMALPSPDVSGD